MIIIDSANPAIKMDSTNPVWKLGTLQKGLVLDMPLKAKYHNPGTDIFTDRTPYENHGANNGGDVDTDHTTFVAANNDYVDCSDDSSLNITGEITISAWIKSTGQSVPYVGIVEKGAHTDGYLLRVSSNKIKFLLRKDGDTPSYEIIEANNDLSIGSWTHCVARRDSSNDMHIYINNVLQTDTANFISVLDPSTFNLKIGQYATYYLDGDMALLKIWNRALSAAEIELLYDMGRN